MPIYRQPTVPKPERPWEVSATYPGQAAWRAALAMLLSVCGGLAFVYFAVYNLGGVGPIQAGWITVVALALALLWLAGFVYRHLTGALVVQRADRERRGF
jgi:hypothetical protein